MKETPIYLSTTKFYVELTKVYIRLHESQTALSILKDMKDQKQMIGNTLFYELLEVALQERDGLVLRILVSWSTSNSYMKFSYHQLNRILDISSDEGDSLLVKTVFRVLK